MVGFIRFGQDSEASGNTKMTTARLGLSTHQFS
jgi:hypothetical protein